MATTSHTILGLATALVRATGCSMIVFEAYNSGGSQNWSRTFPSLDEDAIDRLTQSDGTAAIEVAGVGEARDLFQTVAREATENYTSIIGGEIELIVPNGDDVDTLRFSIDSIDHPVWTDGEWRHELAPNRL